MKLLNCDSQDITTDDEGESEEETETDGERNYT